MAPIFRSISLPNLHMSSKGIKLGPKDIVFVIMGPTGAGKSTFVNVARGENVTEVGHGLAPCTKHLLPIIIGPIHHYPGLKDYRLILIDTPGFVDTDKHDVENLRRLAEWLEASRRSGALIGGILYLHDITAKHLLHTVGQNLYKFSCLYGHDSKAMPKTVLVTTKCSSTTLEAELKGEPWKMLRLEVRGFELNQGSAWDVMRLLLHPINLSPPSYKPGEKDIIFPVMGPIGAGKSTFINVALETNVALVGHTTTSCTKHPLPIIIYSILDHPGLEGYRLVLLDTPGFNDTYKKDVEILQRIAKWLEYSRRKGALVGGVLYFHDISPNRHPSTAGQNLLMCSRLPCGYAAMPKTVLVTTNWPSDRNVVFERREEEMKSEHWKTLIEKGLDVRRFQQNRDSAWDIINHLLEGIPSIFSRRNDIDNRLDLQIQAELIKLRMAIPETEAGQELRYTLKQLLKMQEEAVALEESFARTGDPEGETNLENVRETIDKLQDQVKDLQVRLSLPKRFLKTFGIKAGKRR